MRICLECRRTVMTVAEVVALVREILEGPTLALNSDATTLRHLAAEMTTVCICERASERAA